MYFALTAFCLTKERRAYIIKPYLTYPDVR